MTKFAAPTSWTVSLVRLAWARRRFRASMVISLTVAVALAIVAVATTRVAMTQAADEPRTFDVLVRGGTIYNGTGEPPFVADVGIDGDKIAAIGKLTGAKGRTEIDAQGMAVAPGFINMLSWATESLFVDGRGQSDVRQGVTLEVFGEGWSMGPLNERMRTQMVRDQSDLKFDVAWTSLKEYLEHVAERGTSMNVASFVGATSVRIHVLGYADRQPNEEEMEAMRKLVREAMEDGALGVGSSLIYAPAFYADTHELTELCKIAGQYGGIYISHMRSEGNKLLEGVDELVTIARDANIPAEIYHLKAAGRENWSKHDDVVRRVEAARDAGLRITADMYTYTAGATGLDAAMPPWVQEGGYARWRERLRDPDIRQRVIEEMKTPTDKWENLLLAAGSPEKVLVVGFKNESLKHLTGKTLAQVARQRGKSPEETAIDLVIEDGSRVDTVYFMMDEENVKKNIALPWVSFCSDSAALSPEGAFLKSNPHPRAYGTFARLLGKYVRDEKVIPLETAIHKLTWLPARNLRLVRRGLLMDGYHADVVVFDPAKIADVATYDRPHQFATGMRDVLVNGVAVLRDGEHTGAKPGQVVWGPGKRDLESRPPVAMTEEGRRIHAEALLADGHNDLPWEIRTRQGNSFEATDIAKPQPKMNTDIPRLRKGNVGWQFWSVYVPTETAKDGTALATTLEQVSLVQEMMKHYGDTFEMASTAADVERIHKAGKIASMLGVEGGHSIENSLANLRRLYELGARYMTLTHSDTLDWADSATDAAKNGGLSPFGEDVVREMNRLGMLVDLSHVSDETMKDALRVSRAPVIFSHSSARAVADHPRNVSDEMLRLVKENRGVVMVNFYSGFVVASSAKKMARMFDTMRELRQKFPDEHDLDIERKKWQLANPIEPGTIHDVVDHIDHIVRVAGIERVGIGSDFDGVGMLPAQLEDVSAYPLITQELLNRGYTRQQIHLILGGNILRAVREAEEIAAKMAAETGK
ncbi:MAG: membrane dipeptidase [Pirellulales bacterium]